MMCHVPTYSQMRRLRSDKSELEDRIRDLEARLSEQAVCIREMERRQRMERERADDAEMRLKDKETDVAVAADYPIVVPVDGITARWTFTSAPKVGGTKTKRFAPPERHFLHFMTIGTFSSQGSVASVRGDKSQSAIVPEVEIDLGGGMDFTIEAAVSKDAADELTMSVQVPRGQR